MLGRSQHVYLPSSRHSWRYVLIGWQGNHSDKQASITIQDSAMHNSHPPPACCARRRWRRWRRSAPPSGCAGRHCLQCKELQAETMAIGCKLCRYLAHSATAMFHNQAQPCNPSSRHQPPNSFSPASPRNPLFLFIRVSTSLMLMPWDWRYGMMAGSMSPAAERKGCSRRSEAVDQCVRWGTPADRASN